MWDKLKNALKVIRNPLLSFWTFCAGWNKYFGDFSALSRMRAKRCKVFTRTVSSLFPTRASSPNPVLPHFDSPPPHYLSDATVEERRRSSGCSDSPRSIRWRAGKPRRRRFCTCSTRSPPSLTSHSSPAALVAVAPAAAAPCLHGEESSPRRLTTMPRLAGVTPCWSGLCLPRRAGVASCWCVYSADPPQLVASASPPPVVPTAASQVTRPRAPIWWSSTMDLLEEQEPHTTTSAS